MTFSKTVCELDSCVGCNACVNACSQDAVSISDNGIVLNAYIDESKCINCNRCVSVCQNNMEVEFAHPIKCFEGWIKDERERIKSSSGGFVRSAVYYFLDNEMPVYSCHYALGKFVYRKVKNREDFDSFAGSKYVKSDTGSVFRDIRGELQTGRKVLFIGLPCQVQGLKSFLNQLYENLYTIDLICHGSPSAYLYERYLVDSQVDVTRVRDITFRDKDSYVTKHGKKFEYWLSPFLYGLTYTENCYHCKFATRKRVSDYTAGDSWGSKLPLEELNKGVSLVLCNTKKAIELLDHLEFNHYDVDFDIAVTRNGQLDHPTERPEKRDKFIDVFLSSSSYKKAIWTCYNTRILKFNFAKYSGMKIAKGIIEHTAQKTKVAISFRERFHIKQNHGER